MAEAKKESLELLQEADLAYTKEQFLKAKKYYHKRDLLTALLEDGKLYKFSEVDKILENFKKRKVN